MDCQDFLVLDLHDFRDNHRRRRRRFLDFVQPVFYAADRSTFVLAGHELVKRPHVVHEAPVVGSASVNLHRRPELDTAPQIHKAAIRVLKACRERVEAELVRPSRYAEFTFPQFRRLQAHANAVATPHFAHIVLQLEPVLVGRDMPALGANIVVLALHLAKIELRDGMGIVVVDHPHGHGPVVKPTIPRAIVVAVLVAPATLHVKAQVLGEPALGANLHRLVDPVVTRILEIGHLIDGEGFQRHPQQNNESSLFHPNKIYLFTKKRNPRCREFLFLYPQADSNRCCGNENPESWATRR